MGLSVFVHGVFPEVGEVKVALLFDVSVCVCLKSFLPAYMHIFVVCSVQ